MLTHPSPSLRQTLNRSRCLGFTLLEIMCAAALVALVAAIAVPSYRGVIEKQKMRQAAQELGQIAIALERYRTTHRFKFPDSLDELPGAPFNDPWEHPYQYLNFDSDDEGVEGKIRKDHNLHPLNSEMDLYSMGPDGDSKAPLTAKASRDDIIWARDGSFIGPASEF